MQVLGLASFILLKTCKLSFVSVPTRYLVLLKYYAVSQKMDILKYCTVNYCHIMKNKTCLFKISNNKFIFIQVPPIDSSSDKGRKPSKVQGNIELRNVKFRYPARPDVQVNNCSNFLPFSE